MRRLLPLIGIILVAALWWWVETSPNDSAAPPPSGQDSNTQVDGLPPEVAETLDLVDAGGPYPYDRDGSTFQNREGLLPDRERGYWREYTVPTPGEDDRGARRLVVGRDGEVYYTADHYQSFELIRQAEE